uniref:Uncharacterized protein n=1 Tax=Mastacembelus armatus TaxID=205130 RepID=A0A3Q3LJI8_9TELE
MDPAVVLMVSLGLVLAACSRGGNTSVFLQIYQCISDLECTEGSYCHSSTKGSTHSRCHACRRRNRRCHRDGMCCPGNHCSNSKICLYILQSGFSNLELVYQFDEQYCGKPHVMFHISESQVGDPCLRSSDCSAGFCCARHFWTRICKPVLHEGQVCTRHHRKGNQGLELFQRCPCGDGLSCQTLRERGTNSGICHFQHVCIWFLDHRDSY